MEHLQSSYPYERLSGACRLLRTDLNHSRRSCYGFEDDDDDPLGRPEITVKISNDWAVSPRNHSRVLQYVFEDTDEDEAEVDARLDVNYFTDSFSNDVASLSQEESDFSEDDEQIVPSNPTYKLTLGEESNAEEDEEEHYEEEEEKEEEEEEEECEDDIIDKEIADKSVVEEETGNRSNPQPP